MNKVAIKRALLSVTDKKNLAAFAKFLVRNQVEIVSTGGTLAFLEDEEIPVRSVESVTQFPEILNGRVKTLHPMIHSAILADKTNPEHMKVLEGLSTQSFDLVCVNLYDFANAIKTHPSAQDVVEQIDIGGPTLLRAAAKNYHSVLVLPSPELYEEVMIELEHNDMSCELSLRKKMAASTFAISAAYDAMISSYFATHLR